VGKLFEDKHLNDVTPNCICFYLRCTAWDGTSGTWLDRVQQVEAFHLEVSATEPETDTVQYLPLRVPVSATELASWARPHTTTILDITLLRVPGPQLFIARTA
jgi:hypothetical protein